MLRSTMSRLRWVEASSSTSQRATSPADAATASCPRAKNKPPVPVVQKSTTSTSKREPRILRQYSCPLGQRTIHATPRPSLPCQENQRVRRGADKSRLPNSQARNQRETHCLSRQRCNFTKTSSGHRCPRPILQPLQRQRLQRSLPDKRRSDSSLRRSKAKDCSSNQRQRALRDSLRPRNNRGNQPRGLFLGPIQHSTWGQRHAHGDGASQQHRPMAATRARERSESQVCWNL